MEIPKSQSEALAFFSSLTSSGIRLGLTEVQNALEAMQRPERSYAVLHVAGTNGKGSTCAFAANCLVAQELRVGLYTSPHLVAPNERFCVNGQPIEDSILAGRILEVLDRYPQAATDPPPLTYFEFGTLVALWHFFREGVDVAVLETGLGGRLDATNTVRPRVSAITSLSIDHTDYLGDSIESIAAEKAGIMKPGIPCMSSIQSPQALGVLESKALDVGAPLRVEGRSFELRRDKSSSSYKFRGARWNLSDLQLGLRGEHQISNAAVAISVLEALAESGMAVSERSVRQGLATTRWPGRLEEIATNPPVVLDGAHNLAGVQSLVAAMGQLYSGRRIHLVFGVLADKAWESMIAALFPQCSSVHLTPVASPRSLDPQEYFSMAKGLCEGVAAYPSPLQALAGAMRQVKGRDLVLCAGSLYLIGEVRARLLAG